MKGYITCLFMFRPLYIEIYYLCGVASSWYIIFFRESEWFIYSELMNLYTPVEVVSSMPLLSQENNLLLMGSCFASEMGQRLVDAKFRCDVNPYGVLYNPFPFLRHSVKSLRADATMKTIFSSILNFGIVPCILVVFPLSLQRKHWLALTGV